MRLFLALVGSILLAGCAAPVEEALDEETEVEELVIEESEVPETARVEVPPPEALGLPHGLRFVVPNARPFVVLDVPRAPLESKAPIELVSQPEELSWSVATYRPLPAIDEPEGQGERWVLYGPSGAVCTVVADEIGLLNRSDFDEAFTWREQPDAEDRLERAWEIGAVGQLFTARTSRVDGDCSKARYALPENARPRVWSKQTAIPAPLARAALAEFRLVPEWQELQREIESSWEETGYKGSWDEYEGADPVATLWRDAESGNELVLVDAQAGAGCGGFGGSLWAILEPTRDGFVPRFVGRSDDVPDHVLDANGDGRLELFSGDSLSFDDEDESRAVSIEVPSNHCPC